MDLRSSPHNPFKLGMIFRVYHPRAPTKIQEVQTGQPSETYRLDILLVRHSGEHHQNQDGRGGGRDGDSNRDRERKRDCFSARWNARTNTRKCPLTSRSVCTFTHVLKCVFFNKWAWEPFSPFLSCHVTSSYLYGSPAAEGWSVPGIN